MFPVVIDQSTQIVDGSFIEHVQVKYQDLSKLENLDTQIFYFTQQLRHDSVLYERVNANSRIPNLIKLLKKRIEMTSDEKELNYYRYRLAVTL